MMSRVLNFYILLVVHYLKYEAYCLGNYIIYVLRVELQHLSMPINSSLNRLSRRAVQL